MMTTDMAASMYWMIPNRAPATIILNPDTTNTTTLQVANCWEDPQTKRLATYGNVNLQNPGTTLKLMDSELNPSANGYEIRPEDKITWNGQDYRVIGSRHTTVQSVWECDVQRWF